VYDVLFCRIDAIDEETVEENLHQAAQWNVYTEEKTEEHFYDRLQYQPCKDRFSEAALQLWR